MDMCAICKDRFQTKWYGLNLARKYLKIEIVVLEIFSRTETLKESLMYIAYGVHFFLSSFKYLYVCSMFQHFIIGIVKQSLFLMI